MFPFRLLPLMRLCGMGVRWRALPGWMPSEGVRANVAHVRQARPDSGLGCQEKVFRAFESVPSSLGMGGIDAQNLALTVFRVPHSLDSGNSRHVTPPRREGVAIPGQVVSPV